MSKIKELKELLEGNNLKSKLEDDDYFISMVKKANDPESDVTNADLYQYIENKYNAEGEFSSEEIGDAISDFLDRYF